MTEKRQQILLCILVLIGMFYLGDYVWRERIQMPLNELKGTHVQLLENLEKQTKIVKRTGQLGDQLTSWKKQALPANTVQQPPEEERGRGRCRAHASSYPEAALEGK